MNLGAQTNQPRLAKRARLQRDPVSDRPVVLHRCNISRLREIVDFAESLGATRLELANTQYYGWSSRNQSPLLPTGDQVEAASQVALAARSRLRGVVFLYLSLIKTSEV
jgi:PqqA peptide cyclase